MADEPTSPEPFRSEQSSDGLSSGDEPAGEEFSERGEVEKEEAAQEETAPGQETIDLAAADREQGLYIFFALGAVHEGADSFDKIMTATYLSQFKDPFKEFMMNPVFPFDYQQGIIPYSTTLRKAINRTVDVGLLYFSGGGYLLLPKAGSDAPNMKNNEKILLKEGAQLGRLYLALKETLKLNESELLEEMRFLHERNRAIGPSLEYLAEKS